VDSTTGALAVGLAQTNYDSPGGGIAIYKNERGTPATYTDSQISESRYIAYDDSGDVFVLGLPPQHSGYGGPPIFAELSKGSHKFTTITGIPSYDLYYVTGIQWDGKYIDIQYAYQIAQFAVSGSSGRVAGWIQLNPPLGDRDVGPGSLWLDRANSQVVVPVNHRRALAIFPYPQGGDALKVSPDLHEGHLYNVTISVAP
jgi:hypothetical protein